MGGPVGGGALGEGGAVVRPEMAITIIFSVNFLLSLSTNPHLYPPAASESHNQRMDR
jgi:hypothetical protein